MNNRKYYLVIGMVLGTVGGIFGTTMITSSSAAGGKFICEWEASMQEFPDKMNQRCDPHKAFSMLFSPSAGPRFCCIAK